MPDIHWGYGFPIGGVAAFDLRRGRHLARRRGLRHQLRRAPARPRRLASADVRPDGRGAHGRAVPRRSPPGWARRARTCACPMPSSNAVLQRRRTLGGRARLRPAGGPGLHRGRRAACPGADPDPVSRAGPRSAAGTSSARSARATTSSRWATSSEIFDAAAADALGLAPDQVTVMIHTGSRGLRPPGLRRLPRGDAGGQRSATASSCPTGSSAARPCGSPGGPTTTWGAMAAAANFAFANRQIITHCVRAALRRRSSAESAAASSRLVYDVAHNIAKIETHDGGRARRRRLCVHRKGATRAFPPGHPELPAALPRARPAGAHSRATWGATPTCCWAPQQAYARDLRLAPATAPAGSCRASAAKKAARGRATSTRSWRHAGIIVRAASRATIDEEIPEAYKDVREVVDVVHARRHRPQGGPAAADGGGEGLGPEPQQRPDGDHEADPRRSRRVAWALSPVPDRTGAGWHQRLRGDAIQRTGRVRGDG